ncbi:unnamed protein product [Nezara viridula]|uniref:Uncharacterized protein n=1 Tax=Nezara viridula TaxID=85310 RepID=A0A9P0EA65_NEZVI|nr:unnamed protein product [Nezara viridula]
MEGLNVPLPPEQDEEGAQSLQKLKKVSKRKIRAPIKKTVEVKNQFQPLAEMQTEENMATTAATTPSASTSTSKATPIIQENKIPPVVMDRERFTLQQPSPPPPTNRAEPEQTSHPSHLPPTTEKAAHAQHQDIPTPPSTDQSQLMVTLEAVADSLEQLWISYNFIDKTKGNPLCESYEESGWRLEATRKLPQLEKLDGEPVKAVFSSCKVSISKRKFHLIIPKLDFGTLKQVADLSSNYLPLSPTRGDCLKGNSPSCDRSHRCFEIDQHSRQYTAHYVNQQQDPIIVSLPATDLLRRVDLGAAIDRLTREVAAVKAQKGTRTSQREKGSSSRNQRSSRSKSRRRLCFYHEQFKEETACRQPRYWKPTRASN